MKMEALTTYMKGDKAVKKVYLLNQDYSFGHPVAKAARDADGQAPRRADRGRRAASLAKVKDFALLRGEDPGLGRGLDHHGQLGQRPRLLVKAAKDANLKAEFFTYYAGVVGSPPAMGDAGVGRVKVVTLWNANSASAASQANIEAYKKKYGNESDPYSMGIRLEVEFLARAMEKAKSTEPAKVAAAMEGLKLESPFGTAEVRASDHQAIGPLFVTTFVKADGKYKYTADGAPDYAFKVEMKVDGPDTARPTTCKMQRP